MRYYDHDGAAVWWWMLPMMFVFLAAVVAVIWAVLHASRSQSPQFVGPEEVLAHRLARGEIDTASTTNASPRSANIPDDGSVTSINREAELTPDRA